MPQSEPMPTATDDSSAGDSSAGISSSDRHFLTLRKTADWHGISPSHLSRRVRAEKAAKGHVLHPYVHFEKTEDEQKKVFGFSFPPDYEPGDSVVKPGDGERSQISPERTGDSAGTDSQKRSPHAQERQASAVEGSAPKETPVGRSGEENERGVEELESTLSAVVNSLRVIAKKLSKVDNRQQQIKSEVADPTGEVPERLWKIRHLIEDRFARLNESRMDDSEVVHEQLENIQRSTIKLSERLRQIVDDTREELEWSREQDLEDLSDELQEEIRDPILEVLNQDEQSESVEMNALGFGAVLTLVKVLEERPGLLAGAVSALKPGDGGKNNPDSSGT